MIPEQQWCEEVAELLAVPVELVPGLRSVLLLENGDRERAWRFALTMRMIGLCPVAVARATLDGLKLVAPCVVEMRKIPNGEGRAD